MPTHITFVLIHGAFHGGWCWRYVADLLMDAGARVFAPTMTGLGERAHLLNAKTDLDTMVDDVLGVITAEELTDVILVGHSFGGAVISCVVDRAPEQISRLVYLDAVVPRNGQSAIDQLPPETKAIRIRAALESPGGLAIPVPTGDIFDLPPGPERDWVARRITPHPLAAYTQPSRFAGPVGNDKPRLYVRCTKPLYPAVVPSYERVVAEHGWALMDLPTSHDAMVTAPQAVAALLLDEARAQI